MNIKLTDIPEDLCEILLGDEICCGAFSAAFDNAMLYYEFFEYGVLRRSHRVITDKAAALTVDEITSVLTGISVKDLTKMRDTTHRREEINEMFRIAEKYGFHII